MTPQAFNALILDPAAKAVTSVMGHGAMDTPKARCLLLAIAGQESAWQARTQVPGGYAHGYWQCEQLGSVVGVVNGPFAGLIKIITSTYGLSARTVDVFTAIQYHDPLAYAVARLVLWMDPNPLPDVGDLDGAWECYCRNWRPGKPSPDRWATIYPQAAALFT